MNAGRFAAGGAGLIIVEFTKVERRGCGTVGDLGLWHDDFVPGTSSGCADFIRLHDAVPGIQLGHSGRKARRFRPWEGGAPLTPLARGSTTGTPGSWWRRARCRADAGTRRPRALTTDEIKGRSTPGAAPRGAPTRPASTSSTFTARTAT